VFLPYQPRDHLGKLQRATGLLQNGADQGAEDDDDADGREDAAETGADDPGILSKGIPSTIARINEIPINAMNG
jgi:hypothetical protein